MFSYGDRVKIYTKQHKIKYHIYFTTVYLKTKKVWKESDEEINEGFFLWWWRGLCYKTNIKIVSPV